MTTGEAIDQALTQILGLHGGWALAIECYHDDGTAHLVTKSMATPWALLGLAGAVQRHADDNYRKCTTPGRDDT